MCCVLSLARLFSVPSRFFGSIANSVVLAFFTVNCVGFWAVAVFTREFYVVPKKARECCSFVVVGSEFLRHHRAGRVLIFGCVGLGVYVSYA